MAKAQGPVQNLGPTGERVAANIRTLRGSMKYKELSDRLAEIGRPIPVLGLSRIESHARRVDTDDLVAIALALEVTPTRLMLPMTDHGAVELTPKVSAGPVKAWKWADGEEPLKGQPRDTERFRRRVRPEFDSRFDHGHMAVRAAETVASRIAQLAYDDPEDPEISEKTEERITAIQLAMARLQAEVDDLAHAARQVRSDLFGER